MIRASDKLPTAEISPESLWFSFASSKQTELQMIDFTKIFFGLVPRLDEAYSVL
jgi:hypothetical protein